MSTAILTVLLILAVLYYDCIATTAVAYPREDMRPNLPLQNKIVFIFVHYNSTSNLIIYRNIYFKLYI